jgi:hypothetical protein
MRSEESTCRLTANTEGSRSSHIPNKAVYSSKFMYQDHQPNGGVRRHGGVGKEGEFRGDRGVGGLVLYSR